MPKPAETTSVIPSARPHRRRSGPRPRRQRPPTIRLREAVTALAEPWGRVERHTETDWASITFTGSRHRITLTFAGVQAQSAAENFIAALPDHEFAVPGHLVADATIAEVTHDLLPHPQVQVLCEILLLEVCD